MGIWEILQGLPFEAKAAIAIPTIVAGFLWAISEFRHETRHRADQERITRYEAADLREKRAIIELEPARGQNRGAAMVPGNVVHTGPKAGQHFTAAIRNAGPHLAEDIRITASLGGIDAQTIQAPKTLPPYSPAEPIDVMAPIGVFTYAGIMGMVRAGEPLEVRIDYVDLLIDVIQELGASLIVAQLGRPSGLPTPPAAVSPSPAVAGEGVRG